MQTKRLQHAPDSKLWQCCSPCRAVGVVAVRTADDHSQPCVGEKGYHQGQLNYITSHSFGNGFVEYNLQ